MATQTGCVICQSADCVLVGSVGHQSRYECKICGRYNASDTVLQTTLDTQNDQLNRIQRAILSHRIREANNAGKDTPLLTTYVISDVIENGRLPSPSQQAINIIRYVGDRVSATGLPVDNLQPDFHAAVGSPNRNAAMSIARQLVDAGMIKAIEAGSMQSPDEIIRADLTLAGWGQYDAASKGHHAGNYGFIALKFGDSVLDPFVAEVVKPAVATLGFELIDMRDAAEAGIIDNVMRARIRDAAFVLVDLTHANEGAYWEAGYAEGLGKPVLYLCEKSVFEEQGTHFDTNHCTTVPWDMSAPEVFANELTATLRRSLGLFAT